MGAHAASDAVNLNVKVTINATCDIQTASPADVDFGSVISSLTNVDNAGSLSVNCTNGTGYTIGLDNGQNFSSTRRMIKGTDFVAYNLYRDAGRTLPWGDVAGSVLAGTGTRSENLAPQAHFHDLQVVVVDNDRMVLDNMAQTLEEWGCRVISAHDWPELEARLGRTAGRIDLILSDFHLDGKVSGCELIFKLRQRQKAEIPSILLTGDVDIRHAIEGSAQSMVVAYKPLPSRKLAMLIHETTTATVARCRKSPPEGSPETTKPSFPRASMKSPARDVARIQRFCRV